MARISLTEHGARSISANFRNVGRRVGDMEVMGHEIMKMLEKYEADTWGKDATFTEETRIRWPGTSPLYNTGELKASLTDGQSPHAVREVTPYGIRFGTTVEYSHFLQTGTSKMTPKRPLKFPRALRASLGHIMRRYIVHGERPL